jgi:hypothetical protein
MFCVGRAVCDTPWPWDAGGSVVSEGAAVSVGRAREGWLVAGGKVGWDVGSRVAAGVGAGSPAVWVGAGDSSSVDEATEVAADGSAAELGECGFVARTDGADGPGDAAGAIAMQPLRSMTLAVARVSRRMEQARLPRPPGGRDVER